MRKCQLKHLPFYSWQCITLQLEHRDIDLVIPDDADMDRLLKLLIHSMSTINGAKGSASKLIMHLNKQVVDEYKRHKGLKIVKPAAIALIDKTNKHKVYRKVFL